MSYDEVRAEAFGEIGIPPKDFYRMRYSDYLLLKRGFVDKRDWEQMVMGQHAMLVINPWMKHPITREQIWPTGKDKAKKSGQQISEESLAVLRRFKELEKKQKSEEN